MSDYEQGHPLYRNDFVDFEHAGALAAVKAGPPYDTALKYFAAPLAIIGVPPEFFKGSPDATAVSEMNLPLQAADGIRDYGFTLVRWSLATDGNRSRQHIERGLAFLTAAQSIGESILSRMTGNSNEDGTEIGVTAAEISQIVAYNGVAVALRARALSAHRARFDMNADKLSFDSFSPALLMADRQRMYLDAENLLFLGNNGYWRVSNGMIAMRDARANRDPRGISRFKFWRETVEDALDMTFEFDRGNLLPSLRTIARHGVSLRTRKAARLASCYPKTV